MGEQVQTAKLKVLYPVDQEQGNRFKQEPGLSHDRALRSAADPLGLQ
jgi:hypothetical protein